MENEKKFVILGTGLHTIAVLNKLERDTKGKRKIEEIVKVILDRDELKKGSRFGKIYIDHEKNIGKYLDEETVLIIVSGFYKEIYKRLSGYGVLIKRCLIPNLYTQSPPFDDGEEIIPFDDAKYAKLEEMLTDMHSKRLLRMIMENRGKEIYLVPFEEMGEWGDATDYWDSIKPARKHKKAVVIDGGAYIGDSIEQICTSIQQNIEKYYAFEPCEENIVYLDQVPRKSSLYDELCVIKKGLWNENTELYMDDSGNDGTTACVSSEGTGGKDGVPVMKLDDLMIEPDTDVYLKMDIEGSELKALQGAETLIKTRKPALAICVYHKPNDLINIPFYIKSLVPEYKLFFVGGKHTICIAYVE